MGGGTGGRALKRGAMGGGAMGAAGCGRGVNTGGKGGRDPSGGGAKPFGKGGNAASGGGPKIGCGIGGARRLWELGVSASTGVGRSIAAGGEGRIRR